uniref:Ig-like domain-containing protein n=1 Tax=Hucho hucho TaxID=62062 RepID=A0A4W5QQA2_9TELE
MLCLLVFNDSLLYSLFKVYSSDVDVTHINARCEFREVPDIEYILEFHFSKMMMAWYNQTTGNWTGYTPHGLGLARLFNGNPYSLHQPEVSGAVQYPAMLVCSAYNFYPKPIRVTWVKNGQEVTTDVTVVTHFYACVITDPSMPGPERNKMVIGASAGLIYCWKKSTADGGASYDMGPSSC